MTGPVAVVLAAALVAAAAWLAVPPSGARGRAVPGRREILVRLREGSQRRWRADRRRESVVELATSLAAELRAGQPPAAALERCVPLLSWPAEVPSALTGDGAADLLDHLARRPGASGLGALAACWRAATPSGAALSPMVAAVSDALREDLRVRGEVEAQLAGPRATARLLVALPVLAWLLGSGLGAAPFAVLVSTPYGWASLALGVPLELIGWWWVERLARARAPAGDA